MKNLKNPLMNVFTNSKKGNNMYTSLDNLFDVKNPVRGEAQDVVPIQQQPIDRFNPAQPYLPQDYGSKSKQSNPSLRPGKTVANLVPPPPPPPPKLTADDFPAPVSYESFPPYAPSAPDDLPPSYAPRPSISMDLPPTETPTDDSDSSGPSDDSDSGLPMDIGYRYKPPSPPVQPFLPTISPPKKHMGGYSYDKPPMTADGPPVTVDDNPEFQGYHYNKPAPVMPDNSYHYDKPSPGKPDNGYHYDKPAPAIPDHGYHYGKPETSALQAPSPSYGSHAPPSYHGPDYPELIFEKPHGGIGGTKDDDDMKANDMGMVPPPAPVMKPDAYGPPIDDSGFPHDFPGDFKFHDFDHDHDYHYHHHPTEPPTTEMPRVNRFSYYYLGKKLYYLPLYFSVYFIIYVGALIIKAVLRHKIVYPNSWRPNDMTATFFSKRSIDSWDLSNDNLHELTGKVTHAIGTAAEKYMQNKGTKNE